VAGLTLLSLTPAAGGGSGLPLALRWQTATSPGITITVPPAAAGGSGLPAQFTFAPVIVLVPAAGGGGGLPAILIFSLPPPPQPALPAWQRDAQPWAVAQERQRHVQALWQYGELAYFALLWHIEDHQAGFAIRCPRCYINVTDQTGPTTPPPAEAQIASAYGQGNQYSCPLCYGTFFIYAGDSPFPGIRALIVRPVIVTDMDKNQKKDAKGVVNTGVVAAETTPDFRVRTGDYMFRGDNTRFQLRVPRRTTLRTGFALPWQAAAAIDYNQLNAGLEDPSSVAYIIPPAQDVLAAVLGTYTRIPVDYSWAEIINGALIPEEAPPPAALGDAQGAPAGLAALPGSAFMQDEADGFVLDEAGGFVS
jgi:hypothetical protein